ncbi:MAG TPA: chorismate synthase [Thermoanaerobacterales bacterium]|nr:chorismate synthase [Thermoanaerobacterales bacterium]
MSSIFGNKLKVSIFGESHGKAIGVVLDGLPPGIELDMDFINREMSRRQPGKSVFSTPRKEKDDFEILSGYFQGRSTGTPLCAIIYNQDSKSQNYEELKHLLRPGHADYTGFIKYNKFNDYRGGGHFSGRLTAPLVLAGAVAKHVLKHHNILIASHIKSIHDICDESFDSTNIDEGVLTKLRNSDFPVLDNRVGQKMQKRILDAKNEMDSVGGIIETMIVNLPPGLGFPFFDGVESRLAHALFSIPAVKGVEFGEGFNITKLRGSQANDEFVLDGDKIKTSTNHNGGILGGITTGMPIVFRVAIKPTPSIGVSQKTVDIYNMQEATIAVKGRHDPCIVPRAVPAVEAASALVVLDLMLEREGEYGLSGNFEKPNR